MRVTSATIEHVRSNVWGIAIAVGAGFLRLYRLDTELTTSDAADLPARVMALLCSGTDAGVALKDVVLYRLGGVHATLTYVYASLTKSLGFTLDAQGWVMPVIAVSVLGVYLAYLLGRELAGRGAGCAAAALIACSPIHIVLGRHLGAPWSFEIAFQLALVLVSLRLVKQPTGLSRALLHSGIAVYLWCGNQALAILPVLAFCLLTEQPAVSQWSARWHHGWRCVRSWWMLLPGASALTLAYATLSLRRGHLAHAFFDKQVTPGWYFKDWLVDLDGDLGAVSAGLVLGMAILAVFGLGRCWDRRRVPLVYALVYTLPFWTLISREVTLTRGYIVYGVTGLLLVAAVTPFQVTRWTHVTRVLKHAAPVLISATMLLYAGKAAFRLYRPEWLSVASFQGRYSGERGISAAAAFIRQRSGNATARVLAGSVLEPSQMRVYFRRPYFAMYDAQREDPFVRYANHAHQVAYVVTVPEDHDFLVKHFGAAFSLAALVQSRPGTKPLLSVYSREPTSRVADLFSEAGRREYEQVYPTLCSR